ncbi:rRNA adenine N(6)-methyltransferase [Elysia marginata]|uniref:rRNA adenine N(6)-methyltransferase n=1 Tax=Elysia marginata TaxID=1093978 RepID=A0AAV4JSW9_9GAST|nr:rRNA adenine N(6)-methyltransferase [Elysia marginata]
MCSMKRLLLSHLTYGQYQQYARICCWPQQRQAVKLEVPIPSASRQKYRNGRHVRDENTAAKIVQAILEHRRDPTAPVIHAEAGAGLVCKEFLKNGVTFVIALESTKNYLAEHKLLEEEYGSERFHFVQWPMLNLRLKLNMERVKSSYTQAEAHVSQLLQQRTRPGSSHAIFHIGSKVNHEHHDFLFYILRNMPNDDPIISPPGVEFFFLAHPRFKSKLEFLANIQKASHSTRFSSILATVYLLYDISFIGKFHANTFNPSFKTAVAVQDPEWVDPTVRLLVKLKLKDNVDAILPIDHHVNFSIFLRQIYMKKINRTIPTMEMLVPGCGLRMVALGFTMMDIILRTPPEKLLLLYKHMISWPEYQSSPLRSFIAQMTHRGGGLWPDNDTMKDEKIL